MYRSRTSIPVIAFTACLLGTIAIEALLLQAFRIFPEKRAFEVSTAANFAATLVGLPIRLLLNGTSLNPILFWVLILVPAFVAEVVVLIRMGNFKSLTQVLAIAFLMNVITNAGFVLFMELGYYTLAEQFL